MKPLNNGGITVPLSDILIPNHFELELLVGGEIGSIGEAVDAARGLIRNEHKAGPEIIIVTSFEADESKMTLLVVTSTAAWKVQTSKLAFATPPSGAGDLSAAMFLADYLKSQACDQAMGSMVSSVYSLLSTTLERGEQEIALIKGQEQIIYPDYIFEAKPI